MAVSRFDCDDDIMFMIESDPIPFLSTSLFGGDLLTLSFYNVNRGHALPGVGGGVYALYPL